MSPEDIGNAASVVAAVVGLFGVMAVWAWRRNPRHGRSTSGQVAEAAMVLARLVRRQWQDEAVLRQLFDPAPLPVLWTDCSLRDISDHRQLIGDPVACRADAPQELAAAFRALPRRRLVVLGAAGSGKTTFAVLLTLALLNDRDTDEPVPALLSLATFDPSRDSVPVWLRRRIAADYPALADTDNFGPSAIEDLLAEGRILPVLDALDERPCSSRAVVLSALNDALDPHTPLVLTCRTTDYATAAAQAGVLSGAAAITPAPVRADDALALLRLATPPGPRQDAWNTVSEHLAREPQGAAAQALASPLTVALARSVYADAPGDPAELADARRFSTGAAVEHHLLDSVVPALYARAQRQDPTRRWDPPRAHRYLTYLASRLHRHGTYDLSWWQTYRWVPVLARPSIRAVIWALPVVALCALSGPWPGVSELVTWGVALLSFQCAGAWTASRGWSAARPITAAGLIAACAGLAGVTAGGVCDLKDHEPWFSVQGAEALGLWLMFLVIALSAGLPAPPRLPSRGTLTLGHWRRRLLRAAATVLGAAVLGVAVLTLYALVISDFSSPVTWQSLLAAGQAGLALGALLGAAQAMLQWVRRSTTDQDIITAGSSVRADRLITLVSGATAVCCGVLVHQALNGLFWDVWYPVDIMLPWYGPLALAAALAAHAWPHYTAARGLLAAGDRLPWRLQSFLADAHRLGVLRQVGPVYQFRHARLQQHLAVGHVHLPSTRNPTTRLGSPQVGEPPTTGG
ncbi:NACHT domain-containing protein [Streptomyces sp. NBC_01381]|uniref:NACHT domain-containing protein n=1 Tax=Streptomyces sp. NBC_01381 TaxID=2903845 RepID=UPI00338F5521